MIKRNVFKIGILFLSVMVFPVTYAFCSYGDEAKSVSQTTEGLMANDMSTNTMMNMEAMDIKAMKDDALITEATASIKGTAEGSSISGDVKLREVNGGVEIMAELTNVPNPGKHGFHVHENGSCEDVGKAAGGHFNPKGVAHGFLPKDGHDHAHAGDMGNIEIDEKGNGKLVEFLPGVSLTSGENNVAGKAIILHEKEDDFGQPTGNAGGRIGCGIIQVTATK